MLLCAICKQINLNAKRTTNKKPAYRSIIAHFDLNGRVLKITKNYPSTLSAIIDLTFINLVVAARSFSSSLEAI